MRTAIFCALRWECRPVLKAMRRVSQQTVGSWKTWRADAAGGQVWLVQTGVGPQRAGEAAAAIAANGEFDLFLSAGCAGALSPDLRPGDVVVATAAVRDGQRFDADPAFQKRAGEICTRARLPWRSGTLLTSPTVLTNVAARQAAAAGSGAIAVEMEAAGIARTACAHRIAFAEVRAVLDTVELELHGSGDFMDPESGRLRPLDVLRFISTHPAAAARLLALRRTMAAAERALALFFAGYLEGA